MDKIRIGIITFHCSYNYGSVLQAYALQNYLLAIGYDVKIIDYILKSDFEQYRLWRINNYAEYPKSFLSDIYYYLRNCRRKKNFDFFSKTYLNKTNKRYFDNDDMSNLNKEFDVFICGSDQIWNLDCTKGIIPAYFLSFVKVDKLKISYAPSLAHLSFDVYYENELKTLIESLDYISVREESTIPYLRRITQKDIVNVLDPTLLLNVEGYFDIVKEKSMKNRYIFLYVLEANREIIKYCRELASEKGLQIVYISKKNIKEFKEAINAYGISPGEFLGFIKHSEYIVTNSFHATVFSILFKKRFITFTTKKSSSRMVDFLRSLGIENRIFSSQNEITNEIDYDLVYKKLNRLRSKSIKFLDDALGRK